MAKVITKVMCTTDEPRFGGKFTKDGIYTVYDKSSTAVLLYDDTCEFEILWDTEYVEVE